MPEQNLKDLGKFFPSTRDAEFVFLTDDDIVYPDDYVSVTKQQLTSATGPRAVVGYHGTIYRRPRIRPNVSEIQRWRNGTFDPLHDRKLLGFWRGLAERMPVSQLGTGTVALKAADMPPFEFMQGPEQAVDIRFALWCHERALAQICLPRGKRWLKEIKK